MGFKISSQFLAFAGNITGLKAQRHNPDLKSSGLKLPAQGQQFQASAEKARHQHHLFLRLGSILFGWQRCLPKPTQGNQENEYPHFPGFE